MKTDIFFINPYPYYAKGTLERTIYPPLGLCYLAAYLEKNNFKAKILDANILKLKPQTVLKKIKEISPKFIGIYANIISAKAGLELAKLIKINLPQTKIIFGGPHPTALPKLFAKNSFCTVTGEGEETLLEILKNPPKENLKNIKGTAYFLCDKYFLNSPRTLIKKIDDLPFPAYHLLTPHTDYYKLYARARKSPVLPLLTSRGCPYLCTFCNHNIFGTNFRPHSAERVVAEIIGLIKNYNAKQIDILDDNFTFNVERAEKIIDLILQKKINILINCQNGIRADRLTENLVKKMKKAGVFKVAIGVETVDKKISDSIKKSLNLKKVVQAVKWFRENKIVVHCDFLIGLPGENINTIKKTINFAKKLNPHIAIFALPIPFPGTIMYKQINEKGKFLQKVNSGANLGFYGGKPYFEFPTLPAKTVIKFYRYAYANFYFRPAKIFDVLKNTYSLSELQWVLFTSFFVLKSLVKKNANK